MAESTSGTDILIYDLVENYAEKIYYFCLKKTGSENEAEDLTSDILLNILTSLKKGVVPRYFPAWVWKIARNRYSVWCDKKSRDSESVAGADIGDFEIEDQTADLLSVLIRDDQLQLLRRELSLIASDYRNIVLAYYMQNRKISDIARSLGVPEGTVTSKLYRVRKILKEGMDMAREYGKKSYDPEKISFCASGNQPTGLPWSAVGRKIPDNILCEAHNNPCTLQELALELGIAAPYMEEEAEILVKAELLKKLDDGRYLTNFFIEPKECQNEENEIICTFTERHAAAFWQLAKKALEKAAALGVTTGDYSEEDAQMFFAFYLEQKIENSALSDHWWEKFNRADGGSWGMIGFEQGGVCRLPSAFFNNNGNGWNQICWGGYQAVPQDPVFKQRRYANDVPALHLNITLKQIADGLNPADFSGAEKENLQKLIDDNFCILRKDGTAAVNALVFKGDMESRLKEYLEALPEYQALQKDMKDCIGAVKEIVARYSNPYLQDDFEYYVGMSITELRSTLSRLWKDSGLYTGESAQFCAFYC